MEDFLLVVILIVLFVRWIILWGKLSRMSERIDYLSGNRADPELIKRVFAFEAAVQELRSATRPEPSPASAPATPPPMPVTEPRPASKTAFCPLCGRVLTEGAVCECRTIDTLPEIPREASRRDFLAASSAAIPPPLPYFTTQPEPEP